MSTSGSKPVEGRPGRRAERRASARLVATLLVAGAAAVIGAREASAAEGLASWFRNAEQRAAARLEAGDHEGLAATAPDARWEAYARYGAGDHPGAADAFARAADGEGVSLDERDALRFGQATALTRAGRFEEALSLYEEMLARDPDDADVRHNRDIARALAALEERERQAGQEPGESEDETRSGAGQGAAAGAGQGAADRAPDPSGTQSADAAADPSRRDGADEPGTSDGSAAERDAAARAAREALAGEAGPSDEAAALDGDGHGVRAAAASEGEQATEQWLRRIDDDPAGLLRRRLQQTHRDDYPEVGDGERPW